MRTVIDIPDDEVQHLDRLAAKVGSSRAALSREAVRELLARRPTERRLEAFFGRRQHKAQDGVAYRKRLRHAWPR